MTTSLKVHQSDVPPAFDSSSVHELSSLPARSPSSEARTSISSLPPSLPGAPDAFLPTLHLQIETGGCSGFALPLKTRPPPVPIVQVDPATGAALTPDGAPTYISMRASRTSNSCWLVRGDDPAGTPRCATIYRSLPGRHPTVRILDAGKLGGETFGLDAASDSSPSSKSPLDPSLPALSEFQITPKRLIFSRSQTFRTPLGTYQWRYADKKERRAAHANNILVLERVVSVANAPGTSSSPTDKICTRVAQLVRNDQYRSAGTGSSTAGNGGRLMIDERAWADELDKGVVEEARIMVVATCLVMLKKEVDRRKGAQAGVVVAVA